MKKLPTDLAIFQEIYNAHYPDFVAFEPGKRLDKNYVPVDLFKISERLGIDGDVVFRRLYYYLEEKYAYVRSDRSNAHFSC